MKGGLTVDEPVGGRWQLALDLLELGEDFVMLHRVQMQRHVGWPGADGRIHVAVLTTETQPDLDLAQREVGAAREQMDPDSQLVWTSE